MGVVGGYDVGIDWGVLVDEIVYFGFDLGDFFGC